MAILNLCGEWTLRYENSGGTETINALVPGSVYVDLLANEKMEDPYFRENELAALKLMISATDWG